MPRVTVRNPNVPGYTAQVDGERYAAMEAALLQVVPSGGAGLTAAEMIERVGPMLPDALWPNGEKVGWWQKTVQLDLEARGLLIRDAAAKPLRWYRP